MLGLNKDRDANPPRDRCVNIDVDSRHEPHVHDARAGTDSFTEENRVNGHLAEAVVGIRRSGGELHIWERSHTYAQLAPQLTCGRAVQRCSLLA